MKLQYVIELMKFMNPSNNDKFEKNKQV